MDDWTAWTSHVALLLRRPIKEAGCAFSNDPQTYGKGSKKKRGESSWLSKTPKTPRTAQGPG